MAQWALVIACQDPETSPTAATIEALRALGWVDLTALGVILVFFVLGLFKGLIWQVSRIVILVAAYFVSGHFGHDVAALLGATPPAPGEVGAASAANGGVPDVDGTIYLAYCLLFVGVLIVLSLLAIVIRRMAHKAGLSFFDRLGGGLLGVATGALIVLAGVFAVNIIFPQSELARAAGQSHSLRFSQQAISMLGNKVNDDLRSVLYIQGAPGQPRSQDGQPGEPAPQNGDGLPVAPDPGAPTEAAPDPNRRRGG